MDTGKIRVTIGTVVSSVRTMAVRDSKGPLHSAHPVKPSVDLEFLSRLGEPVSLANIKKSKQFDDWALVRQGRLSTMGGAQQIHRVAVRPNSRREI